MHVEHFLTVVQIGQFHIYLTVETACTKQSLIEDVGTVGGSKYYHAAIGAEAVHLGKQLVEGVFALVV